MERTEKIKIIADDLADSSDGFKDMQEIEKDIDDNWSEDEMDDHIYKNYQHGYDYADREK